MIFDIQRFSLHDGEGVRTVVFFKGCPLRCAWCSNPESQSAAPELLFDARKCIGCRDCLRAAANGEIEWRDGPRVRRDRQITAHHFIRACPSEALTVAGREKSVAAILDEAEKDRVFYVRRGGITLSGGEPFAQPAMAMDLAREAKWRGLDTVAETCLAVPWRHIEPSLPFLDAVYADVKHTDPAKYQAGTGGALSLPRENLRRLAASGVKVTARIPVIPDFNSLPEELDVIVAFVAGLGSIRTAHLIPYHNFGEGKYGLLDRKYPMAGIRSLAPEDLAETAAAMTKKYGLEVRCGG